MKENYDSSKSLREKILFVLAIEEKGSAGEVAAEIMELDALATEESVADMTKETEDELEKLCREGKIEKIKEHRQKIRYTLR